MLRNNIKNATVIAAAGMITPFVAFLPVGYLMFTQFANISEEVRFVKG